MMRSIEPVVVVVVVFVVVVVVVVVVVAHVAARAAHPPSGGTLKGQNRLVVTRVFQTVWLLSNRIRSDARLGRSRII
jgi:hypothetical protein